MNYLKSKQLIDIEYSCSIKS